MRRVVIFTAKDTETSALQPQLIGPIRKSRHIPQHVYDVYHLRAKLGTARPVKDLEIAHYETGRGQHRISPAVNAIVHHFSPDLVLFVGCAGGELSEIAVNDVLIVTKAWPYEVGKEGKVRFTSRAHPLEPNDYLLDVARSISRRTNWRQRIPQQYDAPSSIKFAPTASGNKVLISEEERSWKFAKSLDDEIIAVETEAADFYRSMKDLHRPFLMIRGISDNLANKNTSGKNTDDQRQTRATAHAAAAACQLLLEANYKDMRQTRGLTASTVSESSLQGFWTSEWMYGTEKCSDLVHIERIDPSGIVSGSRISIMPKHAYDCDVHGTFYANRLHLSAIPADRKLPISVALLLNADRQFHEKLTGVAIRPLGTKKPIPNLGPNTLKHEDGVWGAAVTYRKVESPAKETRALWSVYKKHRLAEA